MPERVVRQMIVARFSMVVEILHFRNRSNGYAQSGIKHHTAESKAGHRAHLPDRNRADLAQGCVRIAVPRNVAFRTKK